MRFFILLLAFIAVALAQFRELKTYFLKITLSFVRVESANGFPQVASETVKCDVKIFAGV